MNIQVYKHRLRRITDAMLVRGIEFALEEGLGEIKRIYKFREDDEYFTNFIRFNDETIFHCIITKQWLGRKIL